MAQYTVLYGPRNLTIVAGAAVFALNDLVHIDIVPSGLELEADIGVTDFATETYAMEPVWKHGRTNSCLVRVIVYYYVAVLCFGRRRSGQDCQYCQSPDEQYPAQESATYQGWHLLPFHYC
jgi:hypothetical protein